jgi:hypothetical protein
MLRTTLRPADRESVPGDLLEEYRAGRRPRYGAFRADAWYVWQVATIVWRSIRPFALALAGLTIVSVPITELAPWPGSLLPAPGLSVVHAAIYVWAGVHCSRRTGLIASGIVGAASVSAIAFAVLVAGAVVSLPGLVRAPFLAPFVLVIVSVLLSLSFAFAIVCGAIGGAIGRAISQPSTAPVRSS